MEDNNTQKLEEDRYREVLKHNKLKCEYYNVKVIVGGEKKDTTTTEKKVFWHYREILASQSRYVDTLFSAPLAAALANKGNNSLDNYGDDDNKKSGDDDDDNVNDDDDAACIISSNNMTEILFPDISPSQWERMIHFVTCPLAARKMTVEDAMELVTLYDKYDFHNGFELCDEILSSIFFKDRKEIERSQDIRYEFDVLDRFVQVIVLGHDKNLKRTLVNGMLWMSHFFYLGKYFPENVILTKNHIQKLVPIIAIYSNAKNYENVQKTIEDRFPEEKIDILSCMFPAFFVSETRRIVSNNKLLKKVNEIRITNCDFGVNGIYTQAADDDLEFKILGTCCYWKENEDNHAIINLNKNKVGDWVIEQEDDFGHDPLLLFICPGSQNEALPPSRGWRNIKNPGRWEPIVSY